MPTTQCRERGRGEGDYVNERGRGDNNDASEREIEERPLT